jgi:hypothetical protein
MRATGDSEIPANLAFFEQHDVDYDCEILLNVAATSLR